MLNISYTLSPKLNDNLFKVENLRRYILLTPIPPKLNLKLRWEATFNRIHASLHLSGSSLKKEEVLKLLTDDSSKRMSSKQIEVIKYKHALDYIQNTWLGSSEPVNSTALIKLNQIISNGRLSVPIQEIDYLMEYLEDKQESPIVKAATALIELEKMQPFTDNNFLFALLTSTLFLCKYGYDFRGFLAYEPLWTQDKFFKENYDLAKRAISLTLWLEYFSGCVVTELENIEKKLSNPNNIQKELPDFMWDLNDRQKDILTYLDRPETTITNRKVKMLHKVSQITASRDLTRLTTLGLLFSHGKGRSIHYSKI